MVDQQWPSVVEVGTGELVASAVTATSGRGSSNVYLIDAGDRSKRDAPAISNVLKVPVNFGQ